MNDSQVDQLFQVLTTRPDAGVGPVARSRDEGFGFENLLRQASASTSSEAFDAAPLPPPPHSQSSDRWPENRRSTSPPNDASSALSTNNDRDKTPPPRDDESSTDDHSNEVPTSVAAAAAPPPSNAVARNESQEDSTRSASPASAGPTEPRQKTNVAHATRTKEHSTAQTKAEHSKTSPATDARTKAAQEQPASTKDDDTSASEPAADELLLSKSDAKDSKNATTSEVVANIETQSVAIAVAEDHDGGKQSPSADGIVGLRSQTKPAKSATSKTQKVAPQSSTSNLPTERAEKGKKTSIAESPPVAAVADAPGQSAAKPTKKQPASSEKSEVTEEDPSPDRPRASNGSRSAIANPQEIIAAAIVKDGTPTATTDVVEASAGPKKIGEVKSNLLTSVGRLDRNTTTGARNGQRTDDSQSAPTVDPARFVTRVAKAISTAQERGGPLQLRLSPPELGAMRLELAVKDGALTASIETDNSHARQTLLDNLPALRDRLGEQNIRIERFDVDVRRDGSEQSNPGTQQRQYQQQAPPSQNRNNVPRRPTIDDPSRGPQSIINSITNATINLVA